MKMTSVSSKGATRLLGASFMAMAVAWAVPAAAQDTPADTPAVEEEQGEEIVVQGLSLIHI